MSASALSSPKTPAKRNAIGVLLIELMARAQSLTLSTLIHAVLVLIIGGSVLFKHYSAPPDFTAEPAGLVSNDQIVQPPPDVASEMVRNFVHGLLAIDGRMISLISLDRILPNAELEAA